MEKNERQTGDIVGNTGTINLTCVKQQQQQQECVRDVSDKVHHLPCCVKFTGPTPVSHYFHPKPSGPFCSMRLSGLPSEYIQWIEVDGMKVEEAFFRGRKLQGVSVPLPQGYSGFILGKKKSSKDKADKTSGRFDAPKISNGGENSWETLAKCRNMTFWNHDSLPSQDDASLRLFHLFAVAKALHEPLSAEELNSASVAKIENS